MKNIIHASLFILLIYSFIFGQTDESKEEKRKCPDIEVNGPPTVISVGEIMEFHLKIMGEYDEKQLKIVWSVDKATIVQGQGTKILQVIKTEEKDETITVTVNVDVGGECRLTVSETGLICKCSVSSILFDEVGDEQNTIIKKRFKLFFEKLQEDENTTGYVLTYGTASQVAKRKKLILETLTKKEDIDRIVFINGGKEKKINTRLWIVPAGADPATIN